MYLLSVTKTSAKWKSLIWPPPGNEHGTSWLKDKCANVYAKRVALLVYNMNKLILCDILLPPLPKTCPCVLITTYNCTLHLINMYTGPYPQPHSIWGVCLHKKTQGPPLPQNFCHIQKCKHRWCIPVSVKVSDLPPAWLGIEPRTSRLRDKRFSV